MLKGSLPESVVRAALKSRAEEVLQAHNALLELVTRDDIIG